MKIATLDQSRLIAEEKNTANIFFGAVFVLVGVGITISQGFSIGLSLFSLFFLVSGVIAILFRRVVRVDLDKEAGQADISIKAIVKGKIIHCPITDIQKVQLLTQESTQMNQPQQGGVSATQLETKLLLFLRDGSIVDLSDKQRGMNFGFLGVGKMPNQDIAQKIASFLNVQLEQVGLGTLLQVGSLPKQAVEEHVQENLPPTPPVQG